VRAGRAAALAAALVAVLCGGLWLGGHPGELPLPLREAFVDDNAGLTAEASELIEGNYYRRVDAARLGDTALQGIVRGLRRRYDDRFSQYLSPAALARFNEAITGRFSGVGLSVSEVPRGLLVGRVFKGSPAAGAEIAVGDVIVSADGRPLAGLDAERATALIKGPEGTPVTVGVLRPSTGRRREARLTREEIAVPIVTTSIRDVGGVEVGYVQFASFTEGSHGLLRRAVRRVQRRGAGALVLDLRHNGGGILQEAVLAASVFLPEGELVVTTRSRTQGSEEYRTSGGKLPSLPTVVLIDRATASAAEILAAALADRGGATLVGTRTFGKGVFQQEIDLSNGGALKLTIGEYFTPDGTNLAGTGVQPGVRARDRAGTAADEGLRRALRVAAGRAGA